MASKWSLDDLYCTVIRLHSDKQQKCSGMIFYTKKKLKIKYCPLCGRHIDKDNDSL